MIVLLIILLLLLVLLLLPAGARVCYQQSGISVSVVAGPVRVQILPKKQKPQKSATHRSSDGKKKKTSENQKSAEQNQSEKAPLGGRIEYFRSLLEIGLQAVGCLFHKLRMDRLTLYWSIGGKNSDAAGSAMKYGKAWAGIGMLVPEIEKHFNLRQRDLNVELDYGAEEDRIYAEAQITILIGSLLWIALHYGIRLLVIYVSHKKKKQVKGGMQNGTSD